LSSIPLIFLCVQLYYVSVVDYGYLEQSGLIMKVCSALCALVDHSFVLILVLIVLATSVLETSLVCCILLEAVFSARVLLLPQFFRDDARVLYVVDKVNTLSDMPFSVGT